MKVQKNADKSFRSNSGQKMMVVGCWCIFEWNGDQVSFILVFKLLPQLGCDLHASGKKGS
jgi:hypothetical protein